MKTIIVTITDEKNSFFLDVELPVGYPVSIMYPFLVDLLNQNQSVIKFKETGFLRVANRQKKIIPPNSSLEEAGIWNGDYLSILQR